MGQMKGRNSTGVNEWKADFGPTSLSALDNVIDCVLKTDSRPSTGIYGMLLGFLRSRAL